MKQIAEPPRRIRAIVGRPQRLAPGLCPKPVRQAVVKPMRCQGGADRDVVKAVRRPDDHLAADFEHAPDFGEKRRGRFEMLDDVVERHSIQRLIAKGQRVAIRLQPGMSDIVGGDGVRRIERNRESRVIRHRGAAISPARSDIDDDATVAELGPDQIAVPVGAIEAVVVELRFEPWNERHS